MNAWTMLWNPKLDSLFSGRSVSFTVYTFVSFSFSFSCFYLALSVSCIYVYFIAFPHSMTENEPDQHTTRVRHTEWHCHFSIEAVMRDIFTFQTFFGQTEKKRNKNNNNNINLYVSRAVQLSMVSFVARMLRPAYPAFVCMCFSKGIERIRVACNSVLNNDYTTPTTKQKILLFKKIIHRGALEKKSRKIDW